jgi:chromosome segregation ATPase
MSRSPSPSPERPDTFPAFSEYSHVANSSAIGQLKFAVSMRAEDPDEIIRRMLPLSVIKSRPAVEKKTRPKKEVEIKICEKPECVARRDKLSNLNSENNELRKTLKALENKLAASQNKIALTEKTIGLTEDKIDSLRGQIDDTQVRIFSAEEEVQKLDDQNAGLRNVLNELSSKADALRENTNQIEEDTRQVVAAQTSGDRVIFGKRSTRRNEYTGEIENLSTFKGAGGTVEDSDDD